MVLTLTNRGIEIGLQISRPLFGFLGVLCSLMSELLLELG